MYVFSLTETEFSRKLTEGENENRYIAYKDFVLQVSESSLPTQYKSLTVVEYLNL